MHDEEARFSYPRSVPVDVGLILFAIDAWYPGIGAGCSSSTYDLVRLLVRSGWSWRGPHLVRMKGHGGEVQILRGNKSKSSAQQINS